MVATIPSPSVQLRSAPAAEIARSGARDTRGTFSTRKGSSGSWHSWASLWESCGATAVTSHRSASPAHTIVLVQLFYIFVYVGISSTLSLLMISVALLWRNDRDRSEGHPDPVVPRLNDSGHRRLAPQWGTP